ncbi:MAG: aldo/keto reductase [Actinomycetota bacterium]|nr:aldo/keto reductase [Actinomycetota bacterium]
MRHAVQARLGANGPRVSQLGLGASAIGGLFTPVSEAEGLAVVGAAVELGISYVDTAPLYGLGRSERLIGQALRELPRDDVTVSTKVGRLLRDDPPVHEELPDGMWPDTGATKPVFDFSRDGILRSFEESLARLGLDRVDVLYVHDPHEHLDEAISAALPALAELREQRVLGAIGVGMGDADALARVVREADVDCILLAGRYTLLDRSGADELLPLCELADVAVVAGGVFNSGVLADPGDGARYEYAPAAADVVERARLMRGVCASHGVALPAAALQFPLRHPAVVTVLTGVRSVDELRQNVAHFDADVPEALWEELAGSKAVSAA